MFGRVGDRVARRAGRRRGFAPVLVRVLLFFGMLFGMFFGTFAGGAGAPAAAQPVTLDVGGAWVVIPLPAGWCVYPEAVQAVVKAHFHQVSPENVALVFFGDCAQVRANEQRHTRIRDFAMISIPRSALTANAGTNRGRALDQMELALRKYDPHPAMTGQAARINSAALGISVGEVRSVGVIGRDANGVQTGMLMRQRLGAEDVRQVIIQGITVLNRRMINYNMYGDYESERTLAALLARTQAELARAVASN